MQIPRYLILLLSRRFLLICVLIVLLAKYLSKKFSRDPRFANLADKLPGPYAYPVIGNSVDFLLKIKAGAEPVVYRYMLEYGSTVRLWFGPKLAVLLSDEEDVEAAYFSPNCQSRNTEITRALLGNCLLMAEPIEIWRRKRKAYQPFFSKNNIIQLDQSMNNMIYKYVENMKNAVDGPEIDTLDVMSNFALDITLKVFFNYEMVEEEKSKLNVEHVIKKMMARQIINFFIPLNLGDTLMNLKDPMDVPKLKAVLEDFVSKMIYSNLKSAKAEETLENETINSSNIVAGNFSQLFFETMEIMQKEFDEDELIFYEVIQWILVGSDSTSTTLANCLLALAASPDIQEKVYQEMYQLFGDDDRYAESSDLRKLPYLSQVLKESQRLFTLVPFSVRRVDDNTQIGEHIYPKGTLIIINISGIHHNPKLYPRPHDFDPNNFAPDAVRRRHRCSFIPFSAGPRNCIGKEFGEQAVKLMVIALLRNFSLHTDVKLKDVKPKPSAVFLSQISSLGYPISIRLRQQKVNTDLLQVPQSV